MGSKHAKFLDDYCPFSSSAFKTIRKDYERCEYPLFKVQEDSIETEETIPYPSSLSDYFYDSDESPYRKVKFRKVPEQKRCTKPRINFNEKVKKFERNEYVFAINFKEKHVSFQQNTIQKSCSQYFRSKAKRFEKHEVNSSLLSARYEFDNN